LELSFWLDIATEVKIPESNDTNHNVLFTWKIACPLDTLNLSSLVVTTRVGTLIVATIYLQLIQN